MYTNMLVNCSNCHTPLQLPPGARSISCTICYAVTHIADPRAVPPQPPSSIHAPPPPPSPYNHAPPGPPPNPHGRKKAVIVGISYRYSRHELKRCISEAKCMGDLLINKFKFPESSILMLTEEETDPYRIPTKNSMRMAMYWLVQGCQPGDSLVFYYSGLGSQQRNYTGDEADGYDETLCPLDFGTQGMIVDDEINAAIVRPLPYGVKLHALIDASHSGTVLDLPFLCRMKRSGQYVWEDHRPQSGIWKGSNGGEVISFSSCDDHQTSAHTSAPSEIISRGSMTFCFILAIEHGHGSTYGSILNATRTAIRNAGSNGGAGRNRVTALASELWKAGGRDVITTLASMLLTGGGGDLVTTLASMLLIGGASMLLKRANVGGGLRQEPQLTASKLFDVYAKPFSL